MSQPAVFLANFFVIEHAPKSGYLPVWEEVLDEPDVLIVCATGVRTFSKRVHGLVLDLIARGDADEMEIRRIDADAVFSEDQIRQQIREMTSVRGSLTALARRAGVKTPAITNVLRGDDRPGGRLLEALDLLRIPQTRLYMRRPEGVDPWRSDYRGGVGGTELYYT